MKFTKKLLTRLPKFLYNDCTKYQGVDGMMKIYKAFKFRMYHEKGRKTESMSSFWKHFSDNCYSNYRRKNSIYLKVTNDTRTI